METAHWTAIPISIYDKLCHNEVKNKAHFVLECPLSSSIIDKFQSLATLFSYKVVFHSIFNIWHGPPLYCLHGNSLENRKKLTPIRIMSSVGMNSRNIVYSVGYFQWQYSYEYYFHWSIPGWTLIIVNSAMSITPPKIPSINLNVFIVNEYSYCVSGPWELNLTYPRVMEPTHMTEQCYAISDCIVVLGSLMSLSQLHHQIGISLHLTMATTLCHSRKLDVLTPSWYTFSPLSPSKV